MTAIDSTRTVAEIAAESLGAVKVFERMGIDYCCGGKRPLADVCREKGFEVAAVEADLSAAIANGHSDSRDWSAAPLTDLVNHIVDRHHGFLRREMPAIAQRLEKVYRVYNQRYGSALPGLPEVYAKLQEELDDHLNKEEWILFPAICAYVQAEKSGLPLPRAPFGSVANPIQVMEAEHTEAGAVLESIREITDNYTAPDYACVTYRALMSGLKELEQDLHLHIHLENNILFPRVLDLESKH